MATGWVGESIYGYDDRRSTAGGFHRLMTCRASWPAATIIVETSDQCTAACTTDIVRASIRDGSADANRFPARRSRPAPTRLAAFASTMRHRASQPQRGRTAAITCTSSAVAKQTETGSYTMRHSFVTVKNLAAGPSSNHG